MPTRFVAAVLLAFAALAAQAQTKPIRLIVPVATHAINPWLFATMPYDPIRDSRRSPASRRCRTCW